MTERKLSELFPSVPVETRTFPAMMDFDGSTGYYSKASVTTSGNKVTLVCRFSRQSFTGDRLEYLFRLLGANGYQRVVALMGSSDLTADTNLQDAIQVVVKSSTNTDLVKFLCPVGYLDGNAHTLFFSFDGDAGTAVFHIDGVDADDTGNASRSAPITGTAESGLGSLTIGSFDTSPTNPLDGEIGYCGYRDTYLTNWSDFMTNTGSPKAIDTAGWTQWGSQPLFWNEHGAMDNNLGSAGDMTKNGTIEVARPPEEAVSPIDAPVVGPYTRDPFDTGTVLYHRGLINDVITDDSLNPAAVWGDHILHAHAITPVAGNSDWNRNVLGQYSNTNSYRTLIGCFNNVPSISANIRRYQMSFACNDGTTYPTTDDGVRILFNYVDSSNYWYIYVRWNGSAFNMRLYEYTSAVLTQRGTTLSASTGIDIPMYGFCWVDDFDDNVLYGMHLYETDAATTDKGAYEGEYSVASRPNKAATGFAFGVEVSTNHKWFIGEVSIIDIG